MRRWWWTQLPQNLFWHLLFHLIHSGNLLWGRAAPLSRLLTEDGSLQTPVVGFQISRSIQILDFWHCVPDGNKTEVSSWTTFLVEKMNHFWVRKILILIWNGDIFHQRKILEHLFRTMCQKMPISMHIPIVKENMLGGKTSICSKHLGFSFLLAFKTKQINHPNNSPQYGQRGYSGFIKMLLGIDRKSVV